MILGSIDRLFDRICCQRFAIMELDVRTQMEGPGQPVRADIPAGGQQGGILLGRAWRIEAQELFVHVTHVGSLGREGGDRVPGGNGGGISNIQHLWWNCCGGDGRGGWQGYRRGCCRRRAAGAQHEDCHDQKGE